MVYREPTADEYNLYYHKWLSGKSNTVIQSEMNISEKQMDDLLPYFHYYCKNRYSREYTEALSHREKPPELALSRERRVQLLKYVASGLGEPKIAKLMNVPLNTITLWKMQDPILKDQMEMIVDEMDAKVESAIFRSACGYKTKVRTKTRVKGKGEKGLVDTLTVTETDRVVDGDVAAQKLYVFNRIPTRWSADGIQSNDNNKGALMKLLETAIEGENSKQEDALFDAEQKLIDEKASATNREEGK